MPANGNDFEGFGSVELAAVSSGDDWPRQGLLDPHPKSKWHQAWQRIKQPPAPLALAGLAASVLLVLVAAAAYHSGRHTAALGVTGCAGLTEPASLGDTVAPEGSISSSFEARHDWRGRPRSIEVQGGGVVSADHGRCSDIGADALRDGGNAVDAAVATSLCQGIFNAMASGAGGGHFMLIRLPNGTAECIDAREVAPAAANETMFVGHPDDSITGGLAIAVPLELQGLWLAHSRHGRLPWKRLFRPTIALAKNGFPAHPYLVATLSGANQTAALLRWPAIRDTFLIKEGNRWRSPRVNETCCKRPQLAALLTAVAEEGPQVLYRGRFAQPLADDIQAAGGIITAEDLAAAVAEVRMPIRQRVWGVDWIAAPPPSSAVTVLAALQILAGFEQPLAGGGSLGVHRTVEALKHAFALRMNLGDPGPDPRAPFVNLTDILAALHDPSLLDSLRSAIRDDGVLPLAQYGGRFNISAAGLHPEDHGTSHLNVVDRDSMAVSMTTTVNTGFGSKVLSASTGLLLNNQMDDFSTPGRPNVYGISPSQANFIRPGKKPFSSMSPLIAERGGELLLAVGASGGPRIISAVLQAAVRLLAYGEDLFSAVANPRLHHQLAPDSLFVEDWNTTAVGFHYNAAMSQLSEARGHQVVSTLWGAITQAVYSDPDTGALHAVSDPRKDGAPAAA